jgi:hypothetical protein
MRTLPRAAAFKIPRIVAGMAGGADSIDDLDLLRHGAMPALFGGIRAPSTLLPGKDVLAVPGAAAPRSSRPCLDEVQAGPDLAVPVRGPHPRRGGSRDDAGSRPPERRRT